MNNNKGISLISLVVTIVVICILSSVSISIVVPYFNKIKIAKFTSNMQILQAKADTIYENYLFDNSELYGNKLKMNFPILSEFEVRLIEDKYNCDFELLAWYEIAKNDLTNLGINNYFLDNDTYLYINYENLEIIYSKGMKLNGKIYYSLTGFEYCK